MKSTSFPDLNLVSIAGATSVATAALATSMATFLLTSTILSRLGKILP